MLTYVMHVWAYEAKLFRTKSIYLFLFYVWEIVVFFNVLLSFLLVFVI